MKAPDLSRATSTGRSSLGGTDTSAPHDLPANLSAAGTIALRVHLGSPDHPHTGELLRITDDRTGRSAGLTVMSAHVTSHQPNLRHVVGWVQTDRTSGWVDQGRPGEADGIRALAVHDGALFAATYESAPAGHGRVMRAVDGGWEDTGLDPRTNAVACLAAYRGALYAGTARFHGRGTAMRESENRAGGGAVFRLDSDGWTASGSLGEEDGVASLAVFRDRLWAIPTHGEGLYEFDGSSAWRVHAGPGRRLSSLAVIGDQLLGAGNEGGGVVPWLGDEGGGVFAFEPDAAAWRSLGMQPVTTQVYSIAEHRAEIYASTWPTGRVFRYGSGEWRDSGRLGSELEAMGMIEYNGRLYCGALPSASVYRYEGDSRWVSTGRVDDTVDQRYRRAWGMAVFQGRLYCGSTPRGHVLALEDGVNVSSDRDIGPGVHDIAMSFTSTGLVLYVDGRRVAMSTSAQATGAIDGRAITGRVESRFPGTISRLRVFERVMTDETEPMLLGGP
jgi:hypothetical protein